MPTALLRFLYICENNLRRIFLEAINFTYEKTYPSYACACAFCHDAPEFLRFAPDRDHHDYDDAGNRDPADDHSHDHYNACPSARLLDGAS
jgi:hypothetical protein